SILRAGTDDDFFHLAHELDWIKRLVSAVAAGESVEIEDRVGDELSRPVIRNITATVDLEQLNLAALQLFLRQQNVFNFGVAAERDHRRMLEQQEHVANLGAL